MTTSSSNQRSRRFIDRSIQGSLVVRVFLYWVATLVTQAVLVVFFAVLFSSPDDFYQKIQQFSSYLWLTAIASTLVLPIILYDLVKLSHRWVGPIYRLRAALSSLSRGERIPPMRFREGDFWQELAGDFNVVATDLSRLRSGGDTATEHIVARPEDIA
jgi:hypothetical protein